MAVTMALIARRLQLSQATVSRVLSGKGRGFISEATRARVYAMAEEIGYTHAGTAKTSRLMGVIALWIRNPNAPYYARIIRRLQTLAHAEGSDLILSGYQDAGGEPNFDRAPASAVNPNLWRVDGVIAVDCPRRVKTYLARARGKAVPVVAAGSESVDGLDSVTFDPHSGASDATAHLLRTGRGRVAHLSGGNSIASIAAARCGAYTRAMMRAGRTPLVLTAADESRASARACIRDAIEQGVQFDGLFCLNDDLAIGAYRGLLDANLSVPNDVAIVGYDSIDDTEYLEVPISSVLQNDDTLVRRAWELLWRRIDDRNAEVVSETLRPELVIRDSCGVRGLSSAA